MGPGEATIPRKPTPSVALSGIEKSALIIASAFVVGGLYAIVQPTKGLIIHPGAPAVKGLPARPAQVEHVSAGRSQVYGWISVAMGVGIGWVTIRFGRR